MPNTSTDVDDLLGSASKAQFRDRLGVANGGLTFSISTNDGSAPVAGAVAHVTVPFACTITGWTLETARGVSGSAVLDLWYHATNQPTVANTITAAAKPTLAAAIRNANQPATGWGTSLAAGGRLAVRVDSAAGTDAFLLTLHVVRA